ncbi:hypothetical protein GF325_07440 [Candidatus Bathyarchaeota archaeon]|nr:hypothetical protein [Candidatus Bathyarchaeota archaeon]
MANYPLDIKKRRKVINVWRKVTYCTLCSCAPVELPRPTKLKDVAFWRKRVKKKMTVK